MTTWSRCASRYWPWSKGRSPHGRRDNSLAVAASTTGFDLAALRRVIGEDETHAVVADMDWPRFAEAFGLDTVTFEAPNKPSQFAMLDHFGPQVRLCNVRLEELLRVEIYRRGLHSDAFGKDNLRPRVIPEPVLLAS